MSVVKTLLTSEQLAGRTVEKVTQRSYLLALHLDGGKEAVVLSLDHLDALGASWLDQSDVAKLELETESTP